MNNARFLEFLALYNAVMSTPELSLAERTAAIEAAHDEFASRNNPPRVQRDCQPAVSPTASETRCPRTRP